MASVAYLAERRPNLVYRPLSPRDLNKAFRIETPVKPAGLVEAPISPLGQFVFSVDLEDYFHASVFERVVERADWDNMEWRAHRSTERLLDLLDASNTTATFFVLGWLADRHPALVQEVAARGHEIASHSFWHRRVTTMTRDEFTEDARISKDRLEQICGRPVTGYRAPSFSITPSNAWAFEVLVECGYLYDSSVFPIRRRGYGFPGAPVNAYRIETASGPLDEYPLATLGLGPLTLPAAGGGYLRHFPYRIISASVNEALENNRIGVYYVHPWEVDVLQPRLPCSAVTRWRHYGGLTRTMPRLQRLLERESFTSFARIRAPKLP